MERQAETAIEEILKNVVPIDCSQVYRICSYESNSMKSNNPNSGIYEADVTATLDLNGGNPACNQGGMCIVQGYILNDQDGDSINIEKDDISPTLMVQAHGHKLVVGIPTISTINMRHPECKRGEDIADTILNTEYKGGQCEIIPIMLENHPNDSRIKIDESGNCQTLTSRMGTGGGNVPLCMMPVKTINERQYALTVSSDVANTLTATDYKGTQCMAVPIYLLKIRSGKEGGGKGALWQTNKSATIACNNDQYMFVPIVTEDISYIVRRLTPRECAKLQGFPADWHEGITNAKGKTLPDSAAYKGYGNAVATVCAEYPIAGIVELCNTIY